MAKASIALIEALKSTARNIEKSPLYQWGYMGACNCGFLAQEVTKLTKAEIHRRALERHGDWTEHLNDYCSVNGLLFDDVISELIAFGFDADDLRHLEKLSDPAILKAIPLASRNLHHNIKQDVVYYLSIWVGLLEDELLTNISIDISKPEEAFTEV
jgi:hypothetical protein